VDDVASQRRNQCGCPKWLTEHRGALLYTGHPLERVGPSNVEAVEISANELCPQALDRIR